MITNKTWIYNRMRNLLSPKYNDVPIHSIRFEYDTFTPMLHTKLIAINLEVHEAGWENRLIESGFTFIKNGYCSKIYAFPKGMLD